MEVRNSADKEIQSKSSSFTNNHSSLSLKERARRKEQHNSNFVEVKNSRPTTLDLHPDPTKPNPGPSPSPRVEMIRYRECQRNHSAHLGSHVVDGCGEFMPAGEEGTPLALRCAACDCHRNFHKREAEGETATTPTTPILHLPPPNPTTNHTTPTSCYISFNKPQNITTPAARPNYPIENCTPTTFQRGTPPVMMMAFGGGGGTAAESSSDDLNAYRGTGMGGQLLDQYGGASKKRHRTKFTQEQKDKMLEFAEKLEWRIQKQDDGQVQQFCNELGIKRQVFKVWMHNNKQTLKRKEA